MLDTKSFLIYRTFKPLLKKQYVDDYRLLGKHHFDLFPPSFWTRLCELLTPVLKVLGIFSVFAALELIGHTISTLYFVVILLDYATSQDGRWAAVAVNMSSYVYGFECLNGSLCLLVTRFVKSPYFSWTRIYRALKEGNQSA